MSPRFINAQVRSTLRRLVVGLCLGAYLAMAIGFPLPRATQVEAGAKPFPCQHHRCGCHSAEHCWRSCCCMSMQEKLAWARKNGVKPPDFVLAAADVEAEGHDDNDVGSCCSPRAGKQASCCSSRANGPRKACCSAGMIKHGEPDSVQGKPQNSAHDIDWVLGIHAQKCHGLASLWISSGAVMPAPASLNVPVDSTPPLWWSTPMVCVLQAVSKQPDVPPPRHA